jgi:hypothetical protein
MTTDTKQVSSSRKVRVPGIIAQAGYFIWHLIEMCLAMCIGGIPLIVLFFVGAAKLGYPDLLERIPELPVLAIGFILSLPMIAWMRFRGHEWRPTLEMASTTIVLGIVLVGLGWLGILPRSSLFEWLTRLACPVMIIPMLLRLDHYAGNHHASHSSHPAHAADPADEASCH